MDPQRRRVQPVKGLRCDQGCKLGPHAGKAPALLQGSEAVRAAHRGEHGLGIQRAQRAQIQDLGLDPEAGQSLGGGQRLGHHD